MAQGLLGKIGKAAGVAVLGSALLGALDDANAQVKIYMRVRDVETKEETQVLKKGRYYWLEIMGDNTELKDANGNYLKTTEFGWENVTIPSQPILYLNTVTPDPKYGDDDFFRKDPNSLVDLYKLYINIVRLDYGDRMTRFTGSPSFGPTNRVGVLGRFNIFVKPDCVVSGGRFSIGEAWASADQNGQPAVVKNYLPFVVVDDPQRNSALAIFKSKEKPGKYEFFLGEMPGKTSVFEFKGDLNDFNWTPVFTNDTPGKNLEFSIEFAPMPNQMYFRARTINQN